MTDAHQYCTFYADGHYFGLDVLKVQEVIRYQEMTRVPLAPPVVRGLINLRGQIVTAIDLRRRLELTDRPADQLPVNVVVQTDDGAVSLLVDEIGDRPRDPRYRFIETLGVLIEAYDEAHHAIPDASGVEMLKFLTEQRGLSQSEIPEVGSQGVVSEVLNGKRGLNKRQIEALSRRFHLSPAAFFPDQESSAIGASVR